MKGEIVDWTLLVDLTGSYSAPTRENSKWFFSNDKPSTAIKRPRLSSDGNTVRKAKAKKEKMLLLLL